MLVSLRFRPVAPALKKMFWQLLKKLQQSLLIRGLALPMLSLFGLASASAATQVTVTIPPLASMIAPLLDKDDQLTVLLPDGQSPHGFALRPSHLKAISQADLVVQIGSPVDAWAAKSIARFAKQSIAMADLPGVEKRPIRQGGLWEKKLPKIDQDVSAHPHNEQDDHHEHKAAHDHDHSAFHYDGHLWMSVVNAELMIKAVSAKLQQLNPEQKQQIAQRTRVWLQQIADAKQQTQQRLQAVSDKPFMVLHDAFQYFEHSFGLNGVGSMRLNPEVQPSLKRLLQLRQIIREQQVVCIFKEPQFPDKQVLSLAKGGQLQVGELDPMGSTYKNSNEAYLPYSRFIEKLGEQFYQCLASK